MDYGPHQKANLIISHHSLLSTKKQPHPEGWCILLSRFSSDVFQVKYVIKEDLLYQPTCLCQSPSEIVLQWQWRKGKKIKDTNLQKQSKWERKIRRKQEINILKTGKWVANLPWTWPTHESWHLNLYEESPERGWLYLRTCLRNEGQSATQWVRSAGGRWWKRFVKNFLRSSYAHSFLWASDHPSEGVP